MPLARMGSCSPVNMAPDFQALCGAFLCLTSAFPSAVMMNVTATTAESAATTSSATTAGAEIAAGSARIGTASAGTATRRRAASISLRDGKSCLGLDGAVDGNTP